MSKSFVGKRRGEILRWLRDSWLKDGPPVCFIEGFPGVGKTDLARELRDSAQKQGRTKAITNEVPDHTTPPIDDSLMELAVSLSNLGLPEMETALFGQGSHSLGYAMERALEQPVLIILDEAQRLFVRDSGTPLSEMKGIFAHLRNRPNLPGRLLLLSDRIVERARWSEWIPIHTLPELEPDEAVEALELKIKETGIGVEIPGDRRSEIVRDLSFNPRAIEALVGALRYETLDEIIESNPGLWAARDRDISREFLTALERDLLERTMKHLPHSFQQKLRSLAVYRRSFTRDILRQLCNDDEEETRFRNMLVGRFLASLYRDYVKLHPIVREISRARLNEDDAEFRQAHSSASDHYIRHFRAKQMSSDNSKLGEAFAELRHHLTRARREGELREIGLRFTTHLKRHIKWVTPVPADPEELDERIGVLTVLLEHGGSKGLEFHLASCLFARNKRTDVREALKHAERSTGKEAPEESWLLLAKLIRQVKGVEPAIGAVMRGLRNLKESAPLYHFGAETLLSAGRKDDAVALLKKGVDAVPPEKNRVSLYQRCAELLAEDCRTEQAIALLREGTAVIPPDKGLFSLYQILGSVYCRAGQPKAAIASHLEGLHRISDRMNSYKLAEAALFLAVALDDMATVTSLLSGKDDLVLGAPQIALGKVLQLQMQGFWRAAADAALAARRLNEHHFLLAIHGAFSLLAAEDPTSARRALYSFPKLTFGTAEPHGWLAALINLHCGLRSDASTALRQYLGREIDERSELNEYFLLRLWDEQIAPPKDKQICFYFPIMPPSLTGLGNPLRRAPFAGSILPAEAVLRPRTIARPDERATPDIFVSYSWGEDTTPEGIKREEIVDRLCEVIRRNGHEIGRDKDHLRGGGLIDEFTNDISRADRIVAVISERSLNSKYCMAHELFSAYRRCNFRRVEFQEKIIALVMDDAQQYLNDERAVIRLSEQWKGRLDNLRGNLESVDPRRNSHDSWVEIGLQQEMVSHLPGMISALNNVKMMRGFDAIVADGFREVLDRLPPVRGAPGTHA
jgi:tetratricopeptide (TPR) repeat protein